MADRIKLRRGPKNKIDLNVYELGYATDSTEKRLYFNDGSMVPIPNEKDINDIKAELTEATNVSNQNKKDVSELKESISGIIKTGVAKLVQYSYDIELSETTKKVNIPYERYSSVTDTLKVYVNGLAIQNNQYTITDPVENEGIVTNGYIVLKVERPAGTIVRMEVWKNVPSGEEGEVSGNIIAKNSLPLDRIKDIDKLANNNLLLNGDFIINQRKQQSYVNNARYSFDRWLLSNVGTDEMPHGSISKRMKGVSLTGAKDKQLYITQILDPINVSSLYDKTLTLSCEIFGNNITQGNVFLQICYVNSEDKVVIGKKLIDYTKLKANWERYSVSITVPQNIKQIKVQIGTFNEPGSGYNIINENGELFINNVKLEIGDKPTVFVSEDIELELYKCMRYYEKAPSNYIIRKFAISEGSFYEPRINYAVPKRIPASIKIYSKDNNNEGKLTNDKNNTEVAVEAAWGDIFGFSVEAWRYNELTKDYIYYGWYEADSEIY